jgi:hypothetical protein
MSFTYIVTGMQQVRIITTFVDFGICRRQMTDVLRPTRAVSNNDMDAEAPLVLRAKRPLTLRH